MTEEEIRQFLGVDKLLYQHQEDLVEAVTRRGKHHMSTTMYGLYGWTLYLWEYYRGKNKSLWRKKE